MGTKGTVARPHIQWLLISQAVDLFQAVYLFRAERVYAHTDIFNNSSILKNQSRKKKQMWKVEENASLSALSQQISFHLNGGAGEGRSELVLSGPCKGEQHGTPSSETAAL